MRSFIAKVTNISDNKAITSHHSYLITATMPVDTKQRVLNIDLLSPRLVQSFNELKVGKYFTFVTDNNNHIHNIIYKQGQMQHLRAKLFGIIDRHIIDPMLIPRYEVITNTPAHILYDNSREYFYEKYDKFIGRDVLIIYESGEINMFIDIIEQ